MKQELKAARWPGAASRGNKKGRLKRPALACSVATPYLAAATSGLPSVPSVKVLTWYLPT